MSVIAACQSCGETFVFVPEACDAYICTGCLDAVDVAPECAWDDPEAEAA